MSLSCPERADFHLAITGSLACSRAVAAWESETEATPRLADRESQSATGLSPPLMYLCSKWNSVIFSWSRFRVLAATVPTRSRGLWSE